MITIALLALPAAAVLAVAGWLIERPERPKVRATGSHSRRYLRAARRLTGQSEDEKTIAWLAGLKRPPVRALALARARVAGLAAVLPAARDMEPRCHDCSCPLDQSCEHHAPVAWLTAPGPWDTGGRPAETVELPPLPVDLGQLAARYQDIFIPARPVVVSFADEVTPEFMAEFRDRLDMELRGNAYRPHHTCPDWEPGVDDTGLRHLAYPWADQLAADFDPAEARRA